MLCLPVTRINREHATPLLSGGFVGIAFVLHLAGIALVRAVQPLCHSRSFALRQAVLHIARPGNQTRVILLAVGLGAFFVLGVRSLQANLLRDFSIQAGPDAPDMFLIDIQSAQRDDMAVFLDEANGDRPAPRIMPSARVNSPFARAGGFGMFQAGAAGADTCEFGTAAAVGSAGTAAGSGVATAGAGGAAGTSESTLALSSSVLP